MHELSFTRNILKAALTYAQKVNAVKVAGIYLRIGILRDMEPEWLKRYFGYISKDTPAENADIVIQVEPVVCRCEQCGHKFEIDVRALADQVILCPKPNCRVHDYTLISGSEFIIQAIEVV